MSCPLKILDLLKIVFFSCFNFCVCFVLTMYCWARGLPLRVFCTLSKTPLQKNKFSFASRYQLEIASGLVIGTYAYFPSQ